MIKTVIKIGGSIGQSRKLADLMLRLSDLGPKHGILVVPGGGAFSNSIRDYDRRFGLDKDASHWMAILAMDQFGHLISSLIPDSELVQGLADARKVLAAGRVPVLLTYNLLFQTDELPRSWDVTADSIAAWVADLSGAKQLVLLKSVDGLFSDDPRSHAGVELFEKLDPNQLILCKGVDRYFASILKKYRLDVWIVNGKYPERLTQLLDTGITKGTYLKRSDF
jgi:aspartokinase-like uncharacterized kinase